MSRENRAIREAHQRVSEALRESAALMGFKIVRFGRHRDGYLHAQVSVNGTLIYVHRRFGSWMIPAEPQSAEVAASLPENASLIEVVAPYTYALADEGQRFTQAERRHQEARTDAERDGGTEHAAGRGETAQAA